MQGTAIKNQAGWRSFAFLNHALVPCYLSQGFLQYQTTLTKDNQPESKVKANRAHLFKIINELLTACLDATESNVFSTHRINASNECREGGATLGTGSWVHNIGTYHPHI